MIKSILVALVVALGYLAQIDLRLLDNEKFASSRPTQASVTEFYNQYGGILMNDLYHYVFEYAAMKDMIEKCDIQYGENIVEIGPGSGFLAEKVLSILNASDHSTSTVQAGTYYGIEVSSTMFKKSSTRLEPFTRASSPVDLKLNLVNDSVQTTRDISFSVDKIVLTYVMDLMSDEDLKQFSEIFHSKLRSKQSKICIVNLTYGFTPLSRLVTNVWQLLYVSLGGQNVGGCRPLNILNYFSESKGYEIVNKSQVVSTGLPSEIAVIQKL